MSTAANTPAERARGEEAHRAAVLKRKDEICEEIVNNAGFYELAKKDGSEKLIAACDKRREELCHIFARYEAEIAEWDKKPSQLLSHAECAKLEKAEKRKAERERVTAAITRRAANIKRLEGQITFLKRRQTRTTNELLRQITETDVSTPKGRDADK
jgi:hypothetical protein